MNEEKNNYIPQSAILIHGLFQSIRSTRKLIPKDLLFIRQFHHIWVPRNEADEVLTGPYNWTRRYLWEVLARPCAGAGPATIHVYEGEYIPDEQPLMFYKS